MGLRLDDFSALTPEEFAAAWKVWRDSAEAMERSRWERTRMECCCILQPYTKDTLKPRDVMHFPWDVEPEAPARSEPELTREELIERYKAAKAAAGFI